MKRFVLGFALLLCSVACARAQEAAVIQPAPRPEQITMQRTQCYGQCPIDQLTLRSDGTAAYRGQAYTGRLGSYTGKIAPEKFASLMGWLGEQNFFAMKEEVGQGNGDLPDTIVSVLRESSLPYTVAFRGGASLPLCRKMETAISGAAMDVAWEKDAAVINSGIRGHVSRLLTPNEMADLGVLGRMGTSWSMKFVYVSVTPSARPTEKVDIWTDGASNFQLALPPGQYSVDAEDYNGAKVIHLPGLRFELATSQDVTVEAGKYAAVSLLFKDVTLHTNPHSGSHQR